VKDRSTFERQFAPLYKERNMNILALDLGQRQSVACVYEASTARHEFRRVATTPAALQDLLDEVKPDRVVVEVGLVTGWVSDLVQAAGIPMQVANTAAPAWRWSNTKRKTDRDDALRLAQLSAMNQLPQVHVPPRDVRQWLALIRYRHHLVVRRTQIKNRIRALLARQGEPLVAGKSVWTAESLGVLQTLARPVEDVEVGDLWRGELELELDAFVHIELLISRVEKKLDQLAAASRPCQLLRSIPGVGPRLAEIAVAVIDNPRRFRSGKQVASYVGLTPRQFQSGDQDRRGRISRMGNPLLRAMLVEVGWIGLRFTDPR
jgi:transposase